MTPRRKLRIIDAFAAIIRQNDDFSIKRILFILHVMIQQMIYYNSNYFIATQKSFYHMKEKSDYILPNSSSSEYARSACSSMSKPASSTFGDTRMPINTSNTFSIANVPKNPMTPATPTPID